MFHIKFDAPRFNRLSETLFLATRASFRSFDKLCGIHSEHRFFTAKCSCLIECFSKSTYIQKTKQTKICFQNHFKFFIVASKLIILKHKHFTKTTEDTQTGNYSFISVLALSIRLFPKMHSLDCFGFMKLAEKKAMQLLKVKHTRQ